MNAPVARSCRLALLVSRILVQKGFAFLWLMHLCVLVCSWIESDRDEDFSGMKDAVDPQSELTLRPSPKSDIFSFDISGRTTRNVVDFSISNKTFQSAFHSGELPAPPARKIAIVTCMDARMHPEQFLGLRFGDAHVIRNAGGRISDDALRSLVVSQRMLGTEEVVVIHHTQCGRSPVFAVC